MSRASSPQHPHTLNDSMVLLFAFFCGAIVANIYYAQPIIDLIAPDIGMSSHAASLIVSLTQIGYALGLFFLVPLGDLIENRKLTIVTVLVAAAALVGAAFSRSAAGFLLLSLLIGFGTVSVQMLVPLAAHMAHEQSRGRVVGAVMGGLMLGILLSRPLSSVVADYFGWRAVFGSAASLMVVVIAILALTMPQRRPAHATSYPALLISLGTLFRNTPLLRQRAFYQACMFAAFSMFWTAVPLELARHYVFSQSKIALFALVGAAGAISAPLGGRLADAGYTRIATRGALGVCALCLLPTLIGPAWGVIGLGVAALMLDFCVQLNMVMGQREIYLLDAASRNRLNSLYMTSIFVGGASGSALASTLYERGGWTCIAIVASLLPAMALLRFLYDERRAQ
jgi:predicted MFS family arabinose efflux permease